MLARSTIRLSAPCSTLATALNIPVPVGFLSTTATKLYRLSVREKVRLTSRRHGYMIDVKVIHVIYQIQTMPKQKRLSSAHLARQAKKRKRSQREDPVKRQREQEQNAAAHRLAREDPIRRMEEQP